MKIHIKLLILVIVIGACSKPKYEGSKSDWLEDAFSSIEDNPRIKGIAYWNENWDDKKPVDMKINSSVLALNKYKEHVGADYYIDSAIIKAGKLVAPKSGAYHAAYPGFSINNGEDEMVTAKKTQDFIDVAGKRIAWVYFSNSWHEGISFPQQQVNEISSLGLIPFIRMMPWSEVAPHLEQADEAFAMQKFIDKEFETELKQWALAAKEYGKPLLVEFGTEVNGNWMPWNGEWNGAGEKKYGQAEWPDGPEKFRDAYRYIIDLFKAEGVENITWFFHVNYAQTPEDTWNDMKNYYPGDDYIDWLGLSIYGPLYRNQKWTYLFSEMFDYAMEQINDVSTSKPIAILEFGVGELD